MTFTIYTVLLVLAAHFVGDFICQTDEQAKAKSKDNWALTSHVCSYVGIIFLAGFLLFENNAGKNFMIWVGVNGLLHWVTDYFTSRLNSRLWAAGRTHDFFVGVGFDQVIHYLCLFTTLGLLS